MLTEPGNTHGIFSQSGLQDFAENTIADTSGARLRSNTVELLAAAAPSPQIAPSTSQLQTLIGSPSIAAPSALTPANASVAQATTSPVIAARFSLAPHSTASQQQISSPAIASRSPLVPAVVTPRKVSTPPDVLMRAMVTPGSIEHGQIVTSPELEGAGGMPTLPPITPQSWTSGITTSSRHRANTVSS